MVNRGLVTIRKGGRVRWFVRAPWLLAVVLAGVALSATVDLYQASVSAPDRSDAGLGSAFQAGMRQVLVRVTGRKSASQDPSLSPLIQNARRYMQQYRAASGNQLWVSFDGAAIERWLAQNAQPSWGRERPVTAVWLWVASRSGRTLLTRDDPSELKRVIDQEAALRGIPLVWPTNADSQRASMSADSEQAAPAALAEASKRLGADGVLAGRANDASATAGVRWNFAYQGRSSEIGGAQEGIDHAADAYAQIFAATGASTPVAVEIAGIGSLQNYAAATTFLESMTAVARVGILGFDEDVLRLSLMVRGGADALRRALGQDARVELDDSSESGAVRFRLRR